MHDQGCAIVHGKVSTMSAYTLYVHRMWRVKEFIEESDGQHYDSYAARIQTSI